MYIISKKNTYMGMFDWKFLDILFCHSLFLSNCFVPMELICTCVCIFFFFFNVLICFLFLSYEIFFFHVMWEGKSYPCVYMCIYISFFDYPWNSFIFYFRAVILFNSNQVTNCHTLKMCDYRDHTNALTWLIINAMTIRINQITRFDKVKKSIVTKKKSRPNMLRKLAITFVIFYSELYIYRTFFYETNMELFLMRIYVLGIIYSRESYIFELQFLTKKTIFIRLPLHNIL